MILVTGATGLIGSELVRQLLERGEQVRILRRTTSTLDLLGHAVDRVEQALGDITDKNAVRRAMQGVTHVYHVAGNISHHGTKEADLLRAVNIDGTRNVVDAALASGIRRMVHTSSMGTFGRPERADLPIDETTTWESYAPRSQYSLTKHLGELEVHRGVAAGLDAVIVNPAYVFGPGREDENTNALIRDIRDRRIPAIPPGATNVVDVRDVAAGHILAMERGRTGERYFLGGENLTWQEIFHLFAVALGVRPPALIVPSWLILAFARVMEFSAGLAGRPSVVTYESVRDTCEVCRYSTKKAEEQLGYRHRPFVDTVQDVVAALGRRTTLPV